MLNNFLLRWRKGVVLSATFLAITFVALFVSSCKKHDNQLGAGMLNPEDILLSNGTDTFEILSYTVKVDSVGTNNPSFALLGAINDPNFGEVYNSFYTQIRLSGSSPNFGDVNAIEVDSFVLALEYSGYHGTIASFNFEIYEVDQQMYVDSVYYADQDLAIKPQNWVISGPVDMNPYKRTVIGTDTLSPQLRIKLDPAKAMQIIQDRYANPADFENNSVFTSNYLKGLKIQTSGVAPGVGKGMVGYFNLTDADTKLVIYYKENGVVKSPFNFVITSECADYNRFIFNNTGRPIDQVVNDHSQGQVKFFAQAGGYRGVVEFPSIENLPKNIVVHAAKLYLPMEKWSKDNFDRPDKIVLFVEGTTNTIEATYDATVKGYVANVSGYIQAYNNGSITSKKLMVSPGANFISSANRVVLNGTSTTNKLKPRLIISYTEF